MKTNQRIVLTKRLFHEALLRIMETKHLDKINVTELCKEAGINRATFYRHYNIPRDVLTEMKSQFSEDIKRSVDNISLINSPCKYIEQLCTYLYENSYMVKIFILNNSEDDIIFLFDEFFYMLFSNNSIVTKNRFPDKNEVKLISAYTAGGSYFMLRRWLLDGIEKTPKEIAELVLSFANY